MYQNDHDVFSRFSSKLMRTLLHPRFPLNIKVSHTGTAQLTSVPLVIDDDDGQVDVTITLPHRHIIFMHPQLPYASSSWDLSHRFNLMFLPWCNPEDSDEDDLALMIDIDIAIVFKTDENFICKTSEIHQILSEYSRYLMTFFQPIIGEDDPIRISLNVAEWGTSEYVKVQSINLKIDCHILFSMLSNRTSDKFISSAIPWAKHFYAAEAKLLQFIDYTTPWIEIKSIEEPQAFRVRRLMIAENMGTNPLTQSA